MGFTKTESIPKEILSLASIAKALGHPARLAIVDYLLKNQTCMCKDIVEELPIAQSTVSRHLMELKNAGIIQGSIEDNNLCYCLNESAVTELWTYCQKMTNYFKDPNNPCC